MCAQLCPPPMLVLGREIMADDSQKKRIPTATYNTGGQSRARPRSRLSSDLVPLLSPGTSHPNPPVCLKCLRFKATHH